MTPTLNPPSPDSRIRRALLRKPTPTRGPFPIGGYVYFFRLQTLAGSNRSYRWLGPARVFGCEPRGPERLADLAELPTEGGQPRAYWLRYGHTVVLATGEQLRFASEDELIAAHSVPQEVLEPDYTRGATTTSISELILHNQLLNFLRKNCNNLNDNQCHLAYLTRCHKSLRMAWSTHLARHFKKTQQP